MCGITLSSILGASGVETVTAELIKETLERSARIRHRGGDYTGHHVSKYGVLVHERLAIVDFKSGAQPLFNEDKSLVLIVNGEIYNHEKLAEIELKMKHDFATKSDCQIILSLAEEFTAMFSEKGTLRLLDKLRGMFAFVLMDQHTGRWIAARDHIGMIPICAGKDKRGITWIASEMLAIHDICVSFKDIDDGHFISSDMKCIGEAKKWYNPRWHDPLIYKESALSAATYLLPAREQYLKICEVLLPTTRKIKSLLMDSVRSHMMGDEQTRFACLNSGGLDSAAILFCVSYICKELTKLDGKLREVHSFTIGLKDSPDLPKAKIMADHVGAIHHPIIFTVEEGLASIPSVTRHVQTYDTTTIRASVPLYLLARIIRRMGFKWVFSGEGNDEIWQSYLFFHMCPNAEELQKEGVRLLRRLKKSDCRRLNMATSAWSLEARPPILSREFIEFVMEEISPHERLCGRAVVERSGNAEDPRRIEKWLFRKAFENDLPDEVTWRQKEQFSDSVGFSWIDGMKAQAAKLIDDSEFASASVIFPYNTPATKESFWIRKIFESLYPEQSAIDSVMGGPSVACSTAAAIEWDKSFKNFADPSGRSVAGVHDNAYDSKRREDEKGLE
jgi:asparagine synthase (glutamine-hydrolysing)